MSILKRQHSCVWVAAAYKRTISNSKTVLNFCNKMGYGRVTKLVHALRNHQSFISESFTNHTTKQSEQQNFRDRNYRMNLEKFLKRKILQNISHIQVYI